MKAQPRYLSAHTNGLLLAMLLHVEFALVHECAWCLSSPGAWLSVFDCVLDLVLESGAGCLSLLATVDAETSLCTAWRGMMKADPQHNAMPSRNSNATASNGC